MEKIMFDSNMNRSIDKDSYAYKEGKKLLTRRGDELIAAVVTHDEGYWYYHWADTPEITEILADGMIVEARYGVAKFSYGVDDALFPFITVYTQDDDLYDFRRRSSYQFFQRNLPEGWGDPRHPSYFNPNPFDFWER